MTGQSGFHREKMRENARLQVGSLKQKGTVPSRATHHDERVPALPGAGLSSQPPGLPGKPSCSRCTGGSRTIQGLSAHEPAKLL